MKENIFIILCLFILSIDATAQQQEPFLQWQKSYGGNKIDRPEKIQQTADSGYIIAGESMSKNGDVTNNHGFYDCWIVKLGKNKNIQWQKSYGGSGDDYAISIMQTTDEGYIFAGHTLSNDGDVSSNHGSYDIWIVKLDAEGSIQWQKTLGGTDLDIASGIQQTTDGGYIVAGISWSNDGNVRNHHQGYNTDYLIIKLDAAGNIQWQKCYGGTGLDEAHSIQQTADGGYIAGGETFSNDGDVNGNHGGYDIWLIKLGAAGNIQWQKTLGNSRDNREYNIEQTTDEGYILGGTIELKKGNSTGTYQWIIKLNANGEIQWQKTIEGEGRDIRQTIDGGYISAGATATGDSGFNRGAIDLKIVKLDANGNIKWQKMLGGTNADFAKSIQQTNDRGYIVAGSSYSRNENVSGNHGLGDYWIVKLSPENLNDNISINPYLTAPDCSSANSISCTIKENTKSYTVYLYRFGVLYNSASNVTDHISFHNLPCGAYYATATDANGLITCSKQADIVPPPYNLSSTNITSTTAQFSWAGFDCADSYIIQYHALDETKWKGEMPYTMNNYVLKKLDPSTTYVWRVASEKRKHGIKARGKFSDSTMFTTASAFVSGNNIDNLKPKNSIQLNISPNPAKNFFVINYKDDTPQKLNATLYNATGKAVWNSGLINANALNGKQVNVSQFAKGVFYLKITNKQGELIGNTKIAIAN